MYYYEKETKTTFARVTLLNKTKEVVAYYIVADYFIDGTYNVWLSDFYITIDDDAIPVDEKWLKLRGLPLCTI